VSRVLVTGASGFVGRPLVRSLVQAGEEVHALTIPGVPMPDEDGVRWHEVDLLDRGRVAETIAELRPERLVHLAWYVAHGSYWSSPENARWVAASLDLLRAFAETEGRRAVLVGSCAEYEWGGEADLDEGDSALRPATLYGVCKDGLRRVAEAYAGQVGLELAWGRLFFLYGPHEQSARLVPAVIRALLAGEPVETSAGTQVRDFMHVEDVAAALAALLCSEVTGPVNIASGREVAIAEILDRIGELTDGVELIDRGARPLAPGEPQRIVADVRRLSREVGFEARISLADGLASTVEWWRERARAEAAG
jgi:nucleoside-diphosphate-sugar epimerase